MNTEKEIPTSVEKGFEWFFGMWIAGFLVLVLQSMVARYAGLLFHHGQFAQYFYTIIGTNYLAVILWITGVAMMIKGRLRVVGLGAWAGAAVFVLGIVILGGDVTWMLVAFNLVPPGAEAILPWELFTGVLLTVVGTLILSTVGWAALRRAHAKRSRIAMTVTVVVLALFFLLGQASTLLNTTA